MNEDPLCWDQGGVCSPAPAGVRGASEGHGSEGKSARRALQGEGSRGCVLCRNSELRPYNQVT